MINQPQHWQNQVLNSVLTHSDRQVLLEYLPDQTILPDRLEKMRNQVMPILKEQGLEWSDVISFLKEMPSSKLWLAYLPSTQQVAQIALKLRSLGFTNLLIELEYSPNIIGGFILEHQGTRYDASLVSSLQDFVTKYLETNHED